MWALLLVFAIPFLAKAEQTSSPVEARFFGASSGTSRRGLYAVACPHNFTSIVDRGELIFAKGESAVRMRKVIDNLEQLQCQNSSLCNEPDSLVDIVECDNKAEDQVWRCRSADKSSRHFSDPIIDCEQDLNPAVRHSFCMLNGSCVLRYTIKVGLSTVTIISLVGASIALVGVFVMLVARYRRRARSSADPTLHLELGEGSSLSSQSNFDGGCTHV